MLLYPSSEFINIHEQHVIDPDDDEITKVEQETDDTIVDRLDRFIQSTQLGEHAL